MHSAMLAVDAVSILLAWLALPAILFQGGSGSRAVVRPCASGVKAAMDECWRASTEMEEVVQIPVNGASGGGEDPRPPQRRRGDGGGDVGGGEFGNDRADAADRGPRQVRGQG